MKTEVESFSWPDNIEDARALQIALKDKIMLTPLKGKLKFIAGVDAAFLKDKIIAVACVYKYPDMTLIDEAFAFKEISFPYIPGFLSFREGSAFIETLNNLKIKPDVVIFDGQGIAHPVGLGIASHIGLLIDIPSIGCGKSKLVGEYTEPGPKKGDWSPLRYRGRVVGAVLRTKENVRPIFVSPGHKIDLKGSIEIVLGCIGRYRIPEPLRRADSLSKKLHAKKAWS